jgi:hypothetical protein
MVREEKSLRINKSFTWITLSALGLSCTSGKSNIQEAETQVRQARVDNDIKHFQNEVERIKLEFKGGSNRV